MNSRCQISRIRVLLLAGILVSIASRAADSNQWSFAAHLASAGDTSNAAIEFRRIALIENDPAAVSVAYWLSAHQYWKLKQPDISCKMLDRSEDADVGIGPQASLLRGEDARLTKSWDEAAFHFQSVLNGKPSPEMRTYAIRNLASAEMRKGNIATARDMIRMETNDTTQMRAALDLYERGTDHAPVVGGLLGLIPGLGYAYNGEYANAIRSLLLNTLFGFAMYHTASRDQWGAFVPVAFFEITWYTGSIYGGVDSAHRYNQNRRDACDEALRGKASFEPDWIQVPLIKLQFQF